jgi:hypothetical protein
MVDHEGAPLGRITHIYLEEVTGEPEWALVATGVLRVFVPLVDATEQQDQVRDPVERVLVSDAPVIRPSRRLSRRPPPGCTATTAAPRAALGKCQADAEGWASRSPPAGAGLDPRAGPRPGGRRFPAYPAAAGRRGAASAAAPAAPTRTPQPRTPRNRRHAWQAT